MDTNREIYILLQPAGCTYALWDTIGMLRWETDNDDFCRPISDDSPDPIVWTNWEEELKILSRALPEKRCMLQISAIDNSPPRMVYFIDGVVHVHVATVTYHWPPPPAEYESDGAPADVEPAKREA